MEVVDGLRLQHETLLGGQLHGYRSPDVAGLYVTAPSRDEARREAMAVARLIEARRQASQADKVAGAMSA